MNKVGSYSAYSANYYDKTVQERKQKEKTEAAGAAKEIKSESPALSDKAKDLLKELQKKYRNMDFMVASYETDEEAPSYLARGTKEYSVLIDPEELEKMAEDADYREKTLSLLEQAKGKLEEAKSQIGNNKDEAVHLGVSIGKDGTLSYFAVLEKMNEGQRERLEKSREQKKEEKIEDEKKLKDKNLPEQRSFKKAIVRAGSVEELLDKIKNFDWNAVKEEAAEDKGSKIDFSV